MRATFCRVAVLLAVAVTPALAHAQCTWAQCGWVPPPQAPNLSGWYTTNQCGLLYGPMYCPRPPFPPFQGMIPAPKPCLQPYAAQQPPLCPVQLPSGQIVNVPCGPGGGPGTPTFPNHAFARSPRDFFMVD
jgi:hypothetical protein